MARVAYSPDAFTRQPTGKASKRVEKPAYLDFIRSLPCIVTRREPVEAAHVSYAVPEYGKLGRGKGRRKATDGLFLCIQTNTPPASAKEPKP